MIVEIDEEVVGLVFKAGPLVQGQNRVPQQRIQQAAKPRLDARRAKTEHEAADPNYASTMGANTPAPRREAPDTRDAPTVTAPIVSDKTYGRNAVVTIQNGQGEKRR